MKVATLTLWTVLGASATGVALGPPWLDEDREEARKIFRDAIERAQQREHRKLLEQIDLFVDHSSANWSDAIDVASKHYVIKTTNRNLGRQLGRRLDEQLLEMQELFQTDHLPRNGSYPVWIYPTIQMYSSLADAGGANEHSSFYGSYYSTHDPQRPVTCAYDFRLNFTQVPHSAVHQYIASAFTTTPPPWISEGLAHYFALKVNRQIREWAEDLHNQGKVAYRPLNELVRDSDLSTYVTRDGNPDMAEAKIIQLGLLMRYLLEERQETAQAVDEPVASFANYLRGVLRGREPQKGFREHFGTRRSLESLDKSFRDFRFE